MAVTPTVEGVEREPTRTACPGCALAVLVVEIAVGPRLAGRLHLRPGLHVVVADAYEWEPRAECFRCAGISRRGDARKNCDRCGGTRYVGSHRPTSVMLAMDVAWADQPGARLVGPEDKRRRGEALYALHHHAENSVIIARYPAPNAKAA